MELEQLTIFEAIKISKLVDVLGDALSIEELQTAVNVLDVTRQLYLRQLIAAKEWERQHG